MPRLLFVTSLLLCLVTVNVNAFGCNYVEDGQPVTHNGIMVCPRNVNACIKKVNKGSQRYANGCDVEHKCRAPETSFSDDVYKYYCCYAERCNDAASIGLGISAVVVVAKMLL